ncbi:MAG: ERF family protein [Neglectibacter timonensis]|jgi:ribosomal protein L34E
MGSLIYSAMASAMSEIGAIGKEKVNGQQGFKYRGVDDVMNALQPVLVKNRIFVSPEVLEHTREERVTKSGSVLTYSILRIKYTFYAEDGSSVSAVVIGEGMDSGDKSSNKAMSVAFKYACFQALCIPTEEMKDPDGETPEQIKPKTPSPAPLICKECGEQIKGIKKGDAQFIAAEVSKRTSGLCYHCGVKHGIEL